MAPQIWRPNRDLQYLRQDFEDLFDRMLPRRSARDKGAVRPAIECYVEGQTLIVKADLPGIDQDDVEVGISGDILTIRGKREQEQKHKTRDFVLREVIYGTFERTIRVPRGVDASKISASYRNGVLQISVPIPGAASTKVNIRAASRETGSQVK